MIFDKRSEANISTLVPNAQKQARNFLQAALKAGLVVRIISGSRTFAQQDALYAKGRTKPGPKVTNARGGFSNHNFGSAWDIGIFDAKGKYLPESDDYKKVGEIGRELGIEWGGDWEGLVDQPHFQCKSALPIAKRRSLVLANGGDLTDPRASAAIDALVSGDTGADPIAPSQTNKWLPIEVFFGSKKFDITAYFKDSRTWVSVEEFADYFGGSVVKKAEAPTKVAFLLESEEAVLTGEIHKKRLLVKFADVNTIFNYMFRFDSAKKRLILFK